MFIQRGYGPGGLPLNVYHGNSRHDKLLGEGLQWYRPRSLGNLTSEGDGVSMLSERWTTGRRGEYDTQSLDRRLARGGGGHSYSSDSGPQSRSIQVLYCTVYLHYTWYLRVGASRYCTVLCT